MGHNVDKQTKICAIHKMFQIYTHCVYDVLCTFWVAFSSVFFPFFSTISFACARLCAYAFFFFTSNRIIWFLCVCLLSMRFVFTWIFYDRIYFHICRNTHIFVGQPVEYMHQSNWKISVQINTFSRIHTKTTGQQTYYSTTPRAPRGQITNRRVQSSVV